VAARGETRVPADPVETMTRPGEIRGEVALAEGQAATVSVEFRPAAACQGPVALRLGITPSADERTLMAEAVAAAAAADVAIVVVGSAEASESGGYGRDNLAPPGRPGGLAAPGAGGQGSGWPGVGGVRRASRAVVLAAGRVHRAGRAVVTGSAAVARRQVRVHPCRSRRRDELDLVAIPVLQVGRVVVETPRVRVAVAEQQPPPGLRRLLGELVHLFPGGDVEGQMVDPGAAPVVTAGDAVG